VNLERRDAGEGPRRRANLRREVGQRDEVVADQRRRGGEAATGELDAVTGVAGETDDDPLFFLYRLYRIPRWSLTAGPDSTQRNARP